MSSKQAKAKPTPEAKKEEMKKAEVKTAKPVEKKEEKKEAKPVEKKDAKKEEKKEVKEEKKEVKEEKKDAKPKKEKVVRDPFKYLVSTGQTDVRKFLGFPLFCVDWTAGGRIYIGGGGGTAGTGVASGLVVCESVNDQYMRELGTVDTDNTILENIQPHPLRREFVGGVGGFAHVFVEDDSRPGCVNRVCSFQTDFVQEPLQAFSRFNKDGSVLLTGGNDGTIRLWNYPSDIESKTPTVTKEFKCGRMLTCGDLTSNASHVVAVTDDDKAQVLSVGSGNSTPLAINDPNGKPGKVRGARYVRCRNEEGVSSEYLLVVWNAGAKGKSNLILFNTSGTQVVRSAKLADYSASTLQVSNDGRLAAVSTAHGNVYVVSLPSLEPYCASYECHEFPSTGLAFAPDNRALISVSGDKTFKFIPIVYQGNTATLVSVLMAMAVAIIFFAMFMKSIM